MLAPTDEDDPDRIWPYRPSRRRMWRDRGLRAAVWTGALVGLSLQTWQFWRALLK
jgi:hypothetical protein